MLSPPLVSSVAGAGVGGEPVDVSVPESVGGGGAAPSVEPLSEGTAVGAAMTRSPNTSSRSRSGRVSVGKGVGVGVGGAEYSILLVMTSRPSGPFENEIEFVSNSC